MTVIAWNQPAKIGVCGSEVATARISDRKGDACAGAQAVQCVEGALPIWDG